MIDGTRWCCSIAVLFVAYYWFVLLVVVYNNELFTQSVYGVNARNTAFWRCFDFLHNVLNCYDSNASGDPLYLTCWCRAEVLSLRDGSPRLLTEETVGLSYDCICLNYMDASRMISVTFFMQIYAVTQCSQVILLCCCCLVYTHAVLWKLQSEHML